MKQYPETINIILKRKSVRSFTGASVAHEDLELILRAGMAAPSAVNMQPWNFVVVTNRSTLDELAAGLPYAKMLDKAGAAIIVCAVPQLAVHQSPEYAVLDCAAATQNILLAAESLGLGAVWTAAYPRKERMEHVRKVLNIPAGVIPLNVIPIGVPTGEDQPKDKWDEKKIHWERWGLGR